jgi:hypothetical protein
MQGKDLITWGLLLYIAWEAGRGAAPGDGNGAGLVDWTAPTNTPTIPPAGDPCCFSCSRYGPSMASGISVPSWMTPGRSILQTFTYQT